MSTNKSTNQSPKQLKLKSPRFRAVQVWLRPLGYLRSRAASAHCTCRPAPSAWWTCGRSSSTSQEQLKDKKPTQEEGETEEELWSVPLKISCFHNLPLILSFEERSASILLDHHLHSPWIFPQLRVAAFRQCEICLWGWRWNLLPLQR